MDGRRECRRSRRKTSGIQWCPPASEVTPSLYGRVRDRKKNTNKKINNQPVLCIRFGPVRDRGHVRVFPYRTIDRHSIAIIIMMMITLWRGPRDRLNRIESAAAVVWRFDIIFLKLIFAYYPNDIIITIPPCFSNARVPYERSRHTRGAPTSSSRYYNGTEYYYYYDYVLPSYTSRR